MSPRPILDHPLFPFMISAFLVYLATLVICVGLLFNSLAGFLVAYGSVLVGAVAIGVSFFRMMGGPDGSDD
jgi:hypothetical protein